MTESYCCMRILEVHSNRIDLPPTATASKQCDGGRTRPLRWLGLAVQLMQHRPSLLARKKKESIPPVARVRAYGLKSAIAFARTFPYWGDETLIIANFLMWCRQIGTEP